VSFTLTVKAQLVMLLTASLTEQVTAVGPFGKVEPEGGEQVGTPTPGQLSVTAGRLNVTTAVHTLRSVDCVMSAGQMMTGGWLSFTVTVKLQVAVAPTESVAVQTTVVAPFGKVEPEVGAHTTAKPGISSVAVTVKVTTAEHSPAPVVVVMFAGHVITGGWLIVKLLLETSKKMLPTASTLTREVVPEALGTVTDSDPSLAVLAASTIGKVDPPSVESEIFTFAQLTGAAGVFATFHPTVCVDPTDHTTAVFGAVTRNGPDEVVTVACIVEVLMAAPPARLSRAVT
jgi:hypothetical protein